MVVQQYKKVTNYAPNSEREKDKARAFIELYRRHTFLLQFEAGELFLSAQFSFVFSSIRFLSLVVTQIFTLLIVVDTTSTASSDFCRICSLPYQPLLPILSRFDIDIVRPCYDNSNKHLNNYIVILTCRPMTVNIISNN